MERDFITRTVYLEVLFRLWMDDGTVHERDVARDVGTTEAEAKAAISKLLDMHALERSDDGFLSNVRISNDLSKVREANANRTGRPRSGSRLKSVEVDLSPSKSTEVVGKGKENGKETETETGMVLSGESGVLFEPIQPPGRERKAVLDFWAARAMRISGISARGLAEPSDGTIAKGIAKVRALFKLGYKSEWLISLPALVPEDRLDGMLKGDPFVLLRDENPQGGKCHAAIYEGMVSSGMFLSDRQAAILRNLKTLEFVKAMGAKDRSDAQ